MNYELKLCTKYLNIKIIYLASTDKVNKTVHTSINQCTGF